MQQDVALSLVTMIILCSAAGYVLTRPLFELLAVLVYGDLMNDFVD